jgi:predicted ATPase/DNA-binding SARP family transcriptional activator/Tfp pilus assembly protein PilF
MTTLSLQLLGGFHLTRDGGPLTGFATDKARALLAYLAVERTRPHRREGLAALLWPDQSDERARQNLRQALSHLKQALGSDEFLLVTSQDVQLHPQADITTDVSEVESLVKACETHRHRDLEHCLPCLKRQERLLTKYVGEFLAGFPSQNSENFEEWLILTRERLHQAAMNAHTLLANLHERRGDLDKALQHARAQIALEAWREETHRQVMRLYALSGQRSKALAQYHFCRRVLAHELETKPTAETEVLRELIQDEKFPPARKISQPPEPPTAFVGRLREQDDLSERLADPDCRLLTILGMGGLGKSRLALQVARAHAGLYSDGIYFVPLAAEGDTLSAIAAALGMSEPTASVRLSEYMREKELLLVLDNFEHLAASAERLCPLLEAAPGLQILVTSRERLRLREEWVYSLEGLSYPEEIEGRVALANRDPEALVSTPALHPIPRGASVQAQEQRPAQPAFSGKWDSLTLFEIRAAQADSRFRLTAACLADIVAICQLVEGHPLAIELAASTVTDRPPGELLACLRQTFDALAPSLRNLPERHRSLRAVFEHSWNLLKPDEQTQLANLSVFVGGFSAEAAVDAAGTSTAQLADLAAKSLVRRDSDGRYSLHESIRQFAAEKLEDVSAARERHGAYYARWVAGFDGAANAAALELLQLERANLRAAWEFSVGGAFDLTANLLPALSLLYSLRGPLSEGEELFAAALKALGLDISPIVSSPSTQRTQSEIKNSALSAVSALNLVKTSLTLELARLYTAQTRYDEAIALSRSVPVSARSLLIEGQALSAQGEGEAARPVLEKALALAGDDKRIKADCLRELGNVANRRCEYDLAVPLYRQTLALARELGDLRSESATLNNWGSVEYDQGELNAAKAHFYAALAIYRQLGNRLGEAKALNNLSNVLADQGDLAGSLEFSRQALEIHREMGNPRGQCSALNNLGATYFVLKDYDAARRSYRQALALYRASGNRQAEGEALANLALLDWALGRLAEGREHARAAIALSEAVGDKVNLANAFTYLGRIELADGNFPAAESALLRALEIRGDVPHPGRIAEIQSELALLAFEQGDIALARERIAPVAESLDGLEGTDEPERIGELVKRIQQ